MTGVLYPWFQITMLAGRGWISSRVLDVSFAGGVLECRREGSRDKPIIHENSQISAGRDQFDQKLSFCLWLVHHRLHIGVGLPELDSPIHPFHSPHHPPTCGSGIWCRCIV